MSARIPQRWQIAGVLFLSFTLTVGIIQYAFGVFVTPLEQDLGWSRTEVSGAIAFFGVASVAALPVGWLLDRHGTRPILVTSLVLLAISQLLRPWMTELWQFYALSAIQYAALPGAAIISAGRLIGAWFATGRGRAMGLTTMGANVGGIIFSSLTAFLIDAIGWRASYFVYGLLFLALIPVALAVIRDQPPATARAAGDGVEGGGAIGSGLTTSAALRSRAFYLVAFSLVLAQLSYGAVLPNVVPHLENVGVSRGEAAAALSLLAVFGATGKVVFGWMTEVRPARFVVASGLVCEICGLVGLIAAGSSPLFWACIPLFGLGFGALGALMPLLVQETFGLRSFGTIFGVIQLISLSAALSGPLFAGASFDATGSYRFAFGVISALFVGAIVLVSLARPPQRPWDQGSAASEPDTGHVSGTATARV